MRIRISCFVRLLVGLLALCLILGGAHWLRAGHATHEAAVPHFAATTAAAQAWVADQPSDTSSISADLLYGPGRLWALAIVSLWIGLLSGRTVGRRLHDGALRAPCPTEALVGIVELRL